MFAAVVAVERGLDLDSSPRGAQEFAEQRLPFGDRVLGRLVEEAREAPRPPALDRQLGVRGEVELPGQHLLLFAAAYHGSFLSGRHGALVAPARPGDLNC
jgi:hypothetical protein